MSFYIDGQSLSDLNVFGKRGRDSVYGLFNVARTRGGAQALDQMFRYPLNDAGQINRRSAIIRYMMESGMEFPFRAELFDTAEYYLGNTDSRTKLAAEDNTLQRKLKSAVGADTDYDRLHKGVLASVEIVDTLDRFVGEMRRGAAGTDPANPYGAELKELAAIVSDGDMEPLLNERRTKKFAYARTAELDEMIRFRLREKMQKMLAHIYNLDVYIAVAAVARRHGFAFATASTDGGMGMTIEGMYHPQVPNAVGNSLTITPDGNVLFLTGANMAGKSTFMKTLGLAVYLAHVGFPVPAKSMEFSALDGMYTTINLPDNLATGYSHFYAEVMRVKRVAEALGRSKRLLVIFDELFRGTNVKDAYDATVAITSAFAGKRECLFVISTHIIEAGDELRKLCSNVRFIYLPTVMEGSVARYPYTLKEGITSDRHGMMIINNENVVDIIRRGGRQGHMPAVPFAVDKQTLEDLNLLGEFKPGSIFSLFNRTRTRGGKQLLEDMFRQPLSDAAAINERASVFAWFQRQAVEFPATREEFEAVEQHLNSGGGGKLASLAAVGKHKAMQLISRDEAYAALAAGVGASAAFMRALKAFIGKLDRTGVPATIAPMLDELDKLLADKRLSWVFTPDKSDRPWYVVASRDHSLRSQVNEQIQRMMRTVHALDLYTAVAQVAAERGFAYPTALAQSETDSALDMEDFYHPGIQNAVANSVSIGREQNVVFLTGANMAGKSTLMKSFSIAVYLAHMGFPVAAKSMTFSVREGLYTSINVSDNLALGYSHFYAEVVRVKMVAQQVAAGRNLVVVFDELFKGTNVKDAFDATVAVADAFGEHRNCSYVISTHIIEAGHTLAGIRKNLQFVYMPTVMRDGVPTYPYHLTPGITDDRHGMIIIQNEKIIDIIKQAE